MARPLGLSSSLLVAGILAAGLLAPPVRVAQADGETVKVELQDRTSLEDALSVVAKATGAPLTWDPNSRALQGRTVNGNVVFEGTKTEVYEAFRAMLTVYDLVLVPVGPEKEQRIFVMDARATAAIVRLKPEQIDLTDDDLARYENQDGLFVSAVVRAEHLGSDRMRDARNALNRLVTGNNIGSVTEVPSARAFLVTDFAPNVVSIYRVIRLLDQSAAAANAQSGEVVEAVRLENARAADVARELETLAPPAPAPRAPAQRSPEPPAPALRITADERTNQVLLAGPPEEVAQAKEALLALDQRRPEASPRVQVLRLEHARAQQVASIVSFTLNALFPARPGVPRPSVVADPTQNALVVTVRADAADGIRRLVTELDRDVRAEREAAQKKDEAPAAPDPDEVLRKRIETTRIQLDVGEDAALRDAFRQWSLAAKVPLVITPLAYDAMEVPVNFKTDEARSARLLLQLLVNAGKDLEWTVADGAVVVHRRGERT